MYQVRGKLMALGENMVTLSSGPAVLSEGSGDCLGRPVSLPHRMQTRTSCAR